MLPTTGYEPASIIKGDSVTWTVSLTEYPADDGWVLSYAFVLDGDQQTATAAASGADHVVTLSTAETAAFTVGTYHWQAYVTKASQRVTVGEGTLQVRPDYASLGTGYDGRSHLEKVVDALRAALEGRATKTQLSYSVSAGGTSTSISHLSHEELITATRRYEGYLERERRGQDGRSGNRGRIVGRFR